jgi:hypothetical protein
MSHDDERAEEKLLVALDAKTKQLVMEEIGTLKQELAELTTHIDRQLARMATRLDSFIREATGIERSKQ